MYYTLKITFIKQKGINKPFELYIYYFMFMSVEYIVLVLYVVHKLEWINISMNKEKIFQLCKDTVIPKWFTVSSNKDMFGKLNDFSRDT